MQWYWWGWLEDVFSVEGAGWRLRGAAKVGFKVVVRRVRRRSRYGVLY